MLPIIAQPRAISYTSIEAEAELTLPPLKFKRKNGEELEMRFNRLVIRGNLSVQKVQPPGSGAFLAGPYSISLPTIGPVGGATPSSTDIDGYNTLTSLIAAEATDTITVPPDFIYVVDNAVQIPSGKTLVAADGTSVTIKRADGYSGNMIEMNTLTGSTISNITFDGNFSGNSSLEGLSTACCIYSPAGSDNIVQHCRFLNTPSYAIYANASENFNVYYNDFDDCWAGFYNEGGDLTDAGAVTGNSFINTGALRSHNALIINATNNIQVFHNTFEGAGELSPTNPIAPWGSSILITNSELFQIENNTCSQSYGPSFLAGAGCVNGIVKHNYFIRGSNASSVHAAQMYGTDNENTLFTLNLCDGAVATGSSGGNYTTISYNIINSTSNGVEVTDSTVVSTIQGNIINRVSGTGDGILLYNKNVPEVNCLVTGNTIVGFTSAAIGINNTGNTGIVFGITASGNTFTGNNTSYSIPIGITLHVSVSLEGYVSTPAPTPPPQPTESLQGTTIPSFTQIYDASLAVWTVVSGVIYVNGALAGFSANVSLLLYWNHTVYQQNQAGGWWLWTGVTWQSTTDPRTSTGSSDPVAVPSINVERHPVDFLQVGNEATNAYFVSDNRWGQQGIPEGTGSGQFQQKVGRYIPVGSLGEVAMRTTWSWPQFVGGVSTDGGSYQEVKAYPSIIYGRKPGFYGADRWPAYSVAVRLPDSTVLSAAPAGTPPNIASDWTMTGGSVSVVAPSGATPGTNLPKILPLAANSVVASGRYSATGLTGKGHLSFDCWLQTDGTQRHGFNTAGELSHELMVPVYHWGGYTRNTSHPWYKGTATIGGIDYYIFQVAFSAWSFIVYQVPSGIHPVDSNGKFTVDIGAIANDARTRGYIGNNYLVDIELGVEMIYGAGDLTLYDYRVLDT